MRRRSWNGFSVTHCTRMAPDKFCHHVDIDTSLVHSKLAMNSNRSRPRWWLRITLAGAGALLLGYLLLVLLTSPSNQRDWSPDQARMATSEVAGDMLKLRNVRNAVYRSTQDYDVRWEDRSLDLRRLNSVWFVVEPFGKWRGPAHTLLSFGFDDGAYIAISVEIRKQVHESFSPLLGLLRQYELIYIVGDERDLIGLRANHRRDQVYLYPIGTTPALMRALLLSMLDRANALALKPEFYNTLSNSCTSNIVDHIELIAPGRVPFSGKTLLPAYADDLAFDLGLIDSKLPRDRYREAHQINDLALAHADSEDFSAGIRARMPHSTSVQSR